MEAVQNVVSNFATFTGRARRSEFWYWALAVFVVEIVLLILGALPAIGILFKIVYYLFLLAILVPSLAVGVRRLQDTGKPWVWILVGLIPFVGWIILIVFYVADSQPGENEFGPNPKGA
jgi:uncharacterized membrane protein YhaH (DUF805 family)